MDILEFPTELNDVEFETEGTELSEVEVEVEVDIMEVAGAGGGTGVGSAKGSKRRGALPVVPVVVPVVEVEVEEGLGPGSMKSKGLLVSKPLIVVRIRLHCLTEELVNEWVSE